MTTRKLLILGAQGTLGLALCEEFDKHDYEVIALDRSSGDITSLDFVKKIQSVKPEIIINATGYNNVDKAENEEKDLAYKINVEAVGWLAQTAKDLGATFVNYSSDYVFHGDKIDGYAEDESPDPISEYGKSKFDGEKAVQAVGGKYYIIRLSRLFGKCGASSSSKKSFVEIMIGKKDEKEIKVVNEESASPTYAPDLARFTRELIEKKMPFGIYHGANDGGCTWFEWAQEIFTLLGKSPKLISVSGSEFPRPAKRPQNSKLLNTKMPKQRSWQEALKEYLTARIV